MSLYSALRQSVSTQPSPTRSRPGGKEGEVPGRDTDFLMLLVRIGAEVE